MADQSQEREIGRVTERTGSDPFVMAAAASVVLSWYHFFARGNREMGIFVGLWPPTILAFASYFKQKRMVARLEQPVSTIRKSVERMIGNQ